jgi:Cytochrome oxidase complex assembly protein 1
MLGKWPRYLVLYIAATVLITAATFLMVVNSEPYDFAKSFVAQDSRVVEVTGAQTDRRFAPASGFRYTFGERTGEANFTFKVMGSRGQFEVKVVLSKRDGKWTVASAQAVDSMGEATTVVGVNKSLLRTRSKNHPGCEASFVAATSVASASCTWCT